MKSIINYASLFGMFCMLLFACKKDENKIFYEGGTAPVLTSSSATFTGVKADADKIGMIISWTNPNYQFTTGLSSQTVNYLVEMDTVGANFTSEKKQTLPLEQLGDTKLTYTVKQYNAFLLKMGLAVGVPHAVEIRVTTSLTSLSQPKLVSNLLTINSTPYDDAVPPVVTPPASGKLFITGAASPLGWQAGNGSEPEPASQSFTQVTPTRYELTVNLVGGQGYLLIPVYSSWSAKYGFTGEKEKNNPAGDTFMENGNDFISPGGSGLYKIVVDFQAGKFTVTPA